MSFTQLEKQSTSQREGKLKLLKINAKEYIGCVAPSIKPSTRYLQANEIWRGGVIENAL